MHAHVTPARLRDQLLECSCTYGQLTYLAMFYSVHLIYGYMLLAKESMHGGKEILFYLG